MNQVEHIFFIIMSTYSIALSLSATNTNNFSTKATELSRNHTVFTGQGKKIQKNSTTHKLSNKVLQQEFSPNTNTHTNKQTPQTETNYSAGC